MVVGDASSRFLCRSGDNSTPNYNANLFFFDAVALVFARDKNKPRGTLSVCQTPSFLEKNHRF